MLTIKRTAAWLILILIFSIISISCLSFASANNNQNANIEVKVTSTDMSDNTTSSSDIVTTTNTTTSTTTTTTTKVTTTRPPALRKGMSGSDVTTLQKRLVKLGYLHIEPTGYFGSHTLEAVKLFQRTAGLTVDGVVGPETKAKLFSDNAPRAPKTTTRKTTTTTVSVNSSNGMRSLGRFTLTAYCNCSKCCGQWAGGPTKSGTMPKEGRTIAVDPRIIPLGSRVVINGHTYIAEDTGSAIKGNKIDVYFDSHSEALNFGRQSAEVFIKE